jgi:vanillate O-demethylase ferredoxin subunit
VQNPVFDGSFRATRPGTDPFALNRDFVTQIWMPDMASLGRARQSAFFLEKVKSDEDNFVDQASVVFMPVRERVVVDRSAPTPAGVKLFGFVQRATAATLEDFRRAWGASSWAAGAAAAKLQRHVQNDTLPTPAGPPAVDGIDEFWFDDEAAAHSFLTPWQAWLADTLVRPGLMAEGGHFALLAHEQVLFAGPQGA